MTQFLDRAGLVLLWSKIKALLGDGLTSITSNTGTSTKLTSMNSKNNTTLLIKGDGSWISGAVSGSAGAPVVTLSHGGPGTGTDLTTSNGTPTSAVAGAEVTVLSGVTVSADSKGHITGVSTNTLKIKLPNDATLTIRAGDSLQSEALLPIAVLFSADLGTDVGLSIFGGNLIGATVDSNNITLNHTAPTAPGTAKGSITDNTSLTGSTFLDDLVIKTDSYGHVTSVTGSKKSVISAANGKFSVKVGADTVADFTANLSTNDDVTFEAGKNITVTADTTNRKITISHEEGFINAAELVTAQAGSYISGLRIPIVNGHISGSIEPTYTALPGEATETTNGFMSAEDKKALNNINKTIATALTSAITPSGTKTNTEVSNGLTSLLTSASLGNLYLLQGDLVLGISESGDVTADYQKFVEGGSLTNGGSKRHVITSGSYLMVVNTGTTSSPVYKFDIVSGIYDMSEYAKAADYWAKAELVALTETEINAICV